MSSLRSTPGPAAVVVVGAVLGPGALVYARWQHGRGGLFDHPQYLVVAVCGIALIVLGAWLHDNGHRRRGEQTHALRGTQEQRDEGRDTSA